MWVRRVDAAAGSLPGDPAVLFVFSQPSDLATSPDIAALKARYPSALQVGASSGTMAFGRELDDEMTVCVAVGFREGRARLAVEPVAEPAHSSPAGRRLAQQIAAPDLAAVFVLSDGLSVNASALVAGMREVLGEEVVISGGLAGDGPRFADTRVVIEGKAEQGKVAAVGLYGDSLRVSHGCAGGWEPFGPTRTITGAAGTELLELDGEAALDLYRRYLGEEADALPASGLLFPLEIWDPAAPDTRVVRTLIGVDGERRSMSFAGDVPQGWHARLMHATTDQLVKGAGDAAQAARDGLSDAGEETLCLLVSCVGRRLLMGQRTEDELEEIADRIGEGATLAGFYSYGEIAPHATTGQSCLHNQTVTLTLIGEAA